MENTPIKVGQRFQTRGHYDVRVWEVEALFEDTDSLPHARLCQVDRRNEFRTLACEVLLDAARFSPVG
ncbi:MAG: hypothetical protein HKM95_02880 [Inquilinus sp.]|nr:hypothetical protein [Inquilinus sp.]